MLVEHKCQNKQCGKSFIARSVNVTRGWARFCSKSCKAVEQESRTHQHANRVQNSHRVFYERKYGGVAQFDGRGEYVGFCDHFSNDDHDCNK